MMRYAVRHSTVYEYGGEVSHSHHLLHLKPREFAFQRCLDSGLGMKLSRKRDLEQSVLHNVGTEALRGNPKLITPEEHFLEAPG